MVPGDFRSLNTSFSAEVFQVFEPRMKCRKLIDDVQNRRFIVAAGQAPTIPVYGRSGIRHERWPELAKEAVKRNVGT